MTKATTFLLLLASFTAACGNSGSSNGGSAGGASAGDSSSQAGNVSGAGQSATAGSGGSSDDSGGSPASAAGSPALGGAASWVPSPMPLISGKVPAFSSGNGNASIGPDKSNDGDPTTAWVPDKLPAWIAYDLSGVPAAERHMVLVAWYAIHAGGYIPDVVNPSDQSPIDYTIEINPGAGGGQPPAAGWKNVVTESGNNRTMREYLFDLAGSNWVRMSVTKSTDPASTAFDLDVHSAPDGASDAWLLMGDSITHISSTYAFSDLPKTVSQLAPGRYPAIVPAGIGGTTTASALLIIDEMLRDFPGRFVVLGYGTNDHASGYQMEDLVKKVLAAGKIPAIPHVPWSDTPQIQSDGPIMNAAIDALYTKYPEIFHGPDLWAAFKGRTDLIPSGDVHPNEDGQVVWRKQWAMAMTQTTASP